MAELEELLLSMAEPPLAPRDPLSELARRGRRRARRRRAVGTALVLGCVMLVALPTFAV